MIIVTCDVILFIILNIYFKIDILSNVSINKYYLLKKNVTYFE